MAGAEVCRSCGRALNELQCSDCGRPFTMAPSERVFHMGRFGSLPKRCPSCRVLKREYREHLKSIGQLDEDDDARGGGG